MNILYLGVYRDHTGYGNAATETILALDAAGAKVACRPLKFNKVRQPVHPRVLELEQVSLPHYDAVIQHVPPYCFDYDSRAGLNVGIFYTETDPLPGNWARAADVMDLLLVPSRSMADAVRNGGVRKPVEIVHIPADLERYTRTYPVSRWESMTRGRFMFYTVGELAKRKNLSGLLRAFHAEFRPWEQVGLAVKCSLSRSEPAEALKHAEVICSEVKRGLNLYPTEQHYIREDLVADRLTEDDLMGFHLACDCFVQPSTGEAWSIPAFDAMALGRTPIVPAAGGYAEYVTEEAGWLVPTRREPVFGEGPVHADLFTGRCEWDAPDLLALRKAMRQAYEDETARQEKASRGLQQARLFSHTRIGARLIEALQHHGRATPSAACGTHHV